MTQPLNGAPDILKALARQYPAFDGAITLYFAPYKMYRHDVLLARFERAHPRYEYVHGRTGEHVTQEPEEYRLIMESARRTKMPPAHTDWKRVDVWTMAEISFVTFEGYIVHIDFNLNDHSPAFLKALQAYWQQRSGDVAQDWILFQYLVSVGDLYIPILDGYGKTRDPVTVPVELVQGPPETADPEAQGRGKRGEPTPEPSTSAS